MTKKFILTAALMMAAITMSQAQMGPTVTLDNGATLSFTISNNVAELNDISDEDDLDIVVPESVEWGGTMYPVTSIGTAFMNTNPRSVVIPNTVTEIGYFAFYYCSFLEEVTIGTAVESIDGQAFASCGALAVINYNAVNATAGMSAMSDIFTDCGSINTINFGPEVQSLDNDIFFCLNYEAELTTINIAADRLLAITGSSFFGYGVSGLNITVPCTQLAAYQGDAAWSALGTITADCGSNPQTGDTTATDTLHITVYDTVTVFDTVRMTVTDTVTVFDTVVRYVDSIYCDTLYIYDTIYDTISVNNNGVNVTDAAPLKVYMSDGRLIVEGAAAGETLELYDMQGRRLLQALTTLERTTIEAPATGAYLLRVGQRPARKVVIQR